MKQFTKNNQSFICEHCKHLTPIHPKSSRDHCNECLWGKHVDIMPGDRSNKCQGLLEPIGVEKRNQKTSLVFRCHTCGKQVKNVAAPDDNFEILTQISHLPW